MNLEVSPSFLLFIFLVELVWIVAVLSVARTKTEDPTDRIVWLLIILFLNILGVVLYLCFGPKSNRAMLSPEAYEAEIKKRANEGKL